MLGHSSIVLTADTYTSVLPDAAHAAAEKVADLIIKAGCLVPGTRRRRRVPGPAQTLPRGHARWTRSARARGAVAGASSPADRPPAPRRPHPPAMTSTPGKPNLKPDTACASLTPATES